MDSVSRWLDSAKKEYDAGKGMKFELGLVKNEIIRILTDVVKLDICRKSDYDALYREYAKTKEYADDQWSESGDLSNINFD